jgi:hypothetical protein
MLRSHHTSDLRQIVEISKGSSLILAKPSEPIVEANERSDNAVARVELERAVHCNMKSTRVLWLI